MFNASEEEKLPLLIRVFCFLAGLFFFFIGLVVGFIGILLWKWVGFPKAVFTFCSIPILFSVFFFGYCVYGNDNESNPKHRLKEKTYSNDEQNKEVQVLDGKHARDSLIPVPGGREASGRIEQGYYIEHSGSSDL
jgi:hypothetical protein